MKSVIKRILGTIPVLIGVVLLIFIMLRIVPGNAAAMLLGEHVDQATIDRLTEVMGLDKPVIVKFFDYLAGAIHGDLGISYKYNRAVTDMIIEAFPYTLELALLAALFAWVLGLGTGIIAAIRQNSLVDHLFMGRFAGWRFHAYFHGGAAAAIPVCLQNQGIPAYAGWYLPFHDSARHCPGLEQRRQHCPYDALQPAGSDAGGLY